MSSGFPGQHLAGNSEKKHLAIWRVNLDSTEEGSAWWGHLTQKVGGTASLIRALWVRKDGSARGSGRSVFSCCFGPFASPACDGFVASFLRAPLPSQLRQTDRAESAAELTHSGFIASFQTPPRSEGFPPGLVRLTAVPQSSKIKTKTGKMD